MNLLLNNTRAKYYADELINASYDVRREFVSGPTWSSRISDKMTPD